MAKHSVLLIAAVVSLSLPSIAFAHGGNNDANAVHACIGNVSKIVRIVGATGSCHGSETPAHWEIQGPAGVSGTNGTNGIDGASVTFVGNFSGSQAGCPNGGLIYAAGNPPVNAYVCNGTNAANDTRSFRYMTFDTYLESCCWNANDDASLFGGLAPSMWTDGNGLASEMSPDSNVLRTLFVRKLFPGSNALVSSERWADASSTNGKVTAVLMRIRNSTSSAIDWQPFFYFTAYAGWGERASVALNGANVWSSPGDHHSNSTASPVLTLPANQTSTVIFVVPSSPRWQADFHSVYRLNFFAFYNNSLNLPAGLSFIDDLDQVTGSLW